jgi:hypothetical protein
VPPLLGHAMVPDHACSIIWKGGPLSVAKSFGKNSCKLYNHDRMAIEKAEHKSPGGLIDSRLELHGTCRQHLPRFHGVSKKTPVLMSAKSAKKSILTHPLD